MTSNRALRLAAVLVCVSSVTAVRGQNAQPPLSGVIDSVEFRGARRVSQETLRALVASKPGDMTSEETLKADMKALWDTGRFNDIQVETLKGPRGGVIVRFTVMERPAGPAARNGDSQPTTEAILDRFEPR